VPGRSREPSGGRGSVPESRYPSGGVVKGMGCRGLLLDFSILRQGISIGREFGLLSLEEFARLGSFLEHAFYRPGSLAFGPEGVTFDLENPLLRVGAFVGAGFRWDDRPVPPERCTVRVGDAPDRLGFDEIGPDRPLRLAVGTPTHFAIRLDRPVAGHHRARLELRSLAIPPTVWIEFTDALREREGP